METKTDHFRQMKNGKSITKVSLILFFMSLLIGLWGSYLLQRTIERQQEVEESRLYYKDLGEKLRSATDYMNKEVQAFAVTGEMSHFFNYWTEADVTRTREAVLEKMEKANASENEVEYLRKVKEISDELMEIEIQAIQLVLHTKGITEDSYIDRSSLDVWVTQVLSYPENPELAGIPVNEMQEKAISMLFDNDYLFAKQKIDRLVDSYNITMNKRQDKLVKEGRKETIVAICYQIIFIILSFSILGGILLSFHRLFWYPVLHYISEIKEQMNNKNDAVLKVHPAGSLELIEFGETFNHMSESFYEEMEHRKKAEQLMAAAKEEADKANRFKSIFLAQFSHEIKTPLNAVNGYTWLLHETNLTEEQQEYVEHIQFASKNLLEVLNHILDYSKIEAGKMILENMDFSLRELVRELSCILENDAEKKGLQLQVDLDDEIPDRLNGDSVKLYQVLQNLLYNSIKFTEQGSIVLKIQKKGWNSEEKTGTISFSVKDTGCGISKENLTRIFEPYGQGTEKRIGHSGTGLGLAICKEIIQLASDGKYDLTVKSEKGKGSCFSFSMDFKEGTQEKRIEENEEVTSSFARILLVEDNPENLFLEKRILTQMGYTILEAQTPVLAQALVKQEEFDLIFMDIGMPEMNGYELAKKIREITVGRRIPILALTAYRKEELEKKVFSEEFDDYLAKPVNPAILKEKIEFYLKDQSGKKRIRKREDNALQQEDNPDSFQKKYIDTEKIQELLGGNQRAVLELLSIFLTDKRDTKEKIIYQLEQGNDKVVHDLIHSLKGVSANLFMKPLERSCKELLLETETKRIETDDLADLFEVFQKTCSEVQMLLNKLEDIESERKEKNVQSTGCGR